jgi:hypothetical protein
MSTTRFDQPPGAGVTSATVATDREIAFDGPVETVILPLDSMVIGK